MRFFSSKNKEEIKRRKRLAEAVLSDLQKFEEAVRNGDNARAYRYYMYIKDLLDLCVGEKK
ncbi:hypothetical protein [Saccharolobus islandicus]|uniref:hypothetical protein n=1 Tax=Saccharolobus islandicus TaxID=43080 RepID=UPI00064FC189|nr:hypothetical protein [Sulfolobus islandicus]